MGRSRGLWTLAALFWPALAGAEGLYLHVIPVRAPESGAPTPLRIAAYAPEPEVVAAELGDAVRSLGSERLEIDLERYPQLEPTAPDAYRQASFVVDFDEPPVAELRARLLEAHGEAPGAEALRRFTDAAIPHKTLERGWDLASQVARTGAGDCTEHAVLLAALARAVGHPARIVVGLVLVATDAGPEAFGHAWAELHDGDRWRVVDATPLPSAGVVHLPLALLREEGPGYALALAGTLRRGWVREIEILETGP